MPGSYHVIKGVEDYWIVKSVGSRRYDKGRFNKLSFNQVHHVKEYALNYGVLYMNRLVFPKELVGKRIYMKIIVLPD